jgi:hypothetical protein
MTKILRFAGSATLVALFVASIIGVKLYRKYLAVNLPDYNPPQRVLWADQNWSADQRNWFHHADQGTQTFGIPYEWFMALEQPGRLLSSAKLLSDQAYLDRFGFIPDYADANTTKLPVGFARGREILDASGQALLNPQTQARMTSLGLTCAACHTGRLTYQGTTIFIDGGPALTDVNTFQTAVAISVILTDYIPSRFERFAERVLGPGASEDAKSTLHEKLRDVRRQMMAVRSLESSVKGRSVEEGFTRLDALSRIGDTVFAFDMNHPENFAAYSAPVHFPRIWNASWFEWVQYNGSIEQPMTRNAGEALGVRATVNFPPAKDQLPISSVQVDTIFKLEQLLAGDKPPTLENCMTSTKLPKSCFTGLTSPEWPANVLPPINPWLKAKGAALYTTYCQRCHLPAPSEPGFWTAPQWTTTNAAGERYLDLNMVDISHVGTDSAQAEDMKNRTVAVPATLGITDDSGQVVMRADFGSALAQVVTKVVTRWYDSQSPPTPPSVRDKMNGFRPNGIRAPLQYKARPLNGIWATPPYLHNGSVPNLYFLLSPVCERPKTFYLGNREYDADNVGYRIEKLPGGFLFDTSIRGNRNTGHEFNDGSGPGIIGRFLKPDERRALVEYLKSL